MNTLEVFDMLDDAGFGLLPERLEMAKAKAKRSAGQPTKYNSYYPMIAEAFCREDGYTDKQLAALFHCSEGCLNSWKSRYPEFYVSIKRGKWSFDTVHVEGALLKSALGYTYDETTKERRDAVLDEDGEILVEGGMVETKIVTKQVSPNPTSLIFWTKNRKPEDWNDNKKIDLEIVEDEGQLSEEALKERLKAYDEAESGIDMASVEGNG